MRYFTISLAFIAMLGGFDIASAICTGANLGIGTPVALGTGNTQYNVYDGSCKTVQSLQISTSIGPCISEYFLCAVGTKTIELYDDPTTGISYVCSADTTSESCGSDVISLCCHEGFIDD
ncbi:hypothetical protein N8I77_008632 [Diaporthe amygdali]|uniref:Uncharacterized protein n=1 Tax=Phomopsis amygdali TaxID=1214568 RepID=A0AAD9S9P2_PHOAM|nr:hypothetical protein N8I77_008632 [Diaporthe amygdali]